MNPPRRKFNAFVSELSDDEDYNPAADSQDSDDDEKETKKGKMTAEADAYLVFSEDEEEEADSRVTTDEDEDEAEVSFGFGRAKKRARTARSPSTNHDNPYQQKLQNHNHLQGEVDFLAQIDARNAHDAYPPRRRRGGGKRKKNREEERSCNSEWLRWEEELETWGADDDDKEYEEGRRKLAASMERAETPAEFVYPLLPFQSEFLAWGLKQEVSEYKGGILADEMGMGKTIQALSLVLGGRAASHGHDEPSVVAAEETLPPPEIELEKIKATLVVCPLVAVEQWRSEIERFTTEGALKVLVYHGNTRKKIELEDLAEYDIILSTYSTIEHDYRKMLPDKLRCKWCDKALTKKGYKKHLKFHCGPFAKKQMKKKKSSGSKASKDSKMAASKGESSLKRKRAADADEALNKRLDKACDEAERVFNEGLSLLHSVKWVRIILDEAHTIKEKASNTAKAVFALESCYRWLLSGTPLQNRVNELYSLVRFLRLNPFAFFYCNKCECKILDHQMTCDKCEHVNSHFSWWNKFISRPVKTKGCETIEGGQSMKVLKRKILDEVLLRRTKIERAADLFIPPKTVIVRKDAFDEVEEDYYVTFYKDSKSKFDTFVRENTVTDNYANIFDLLTRLRQAVDHPYLIAHSTTHGKKPLLCGLCCDLAVEPAKSGCGHIFCSECLKQAEGSKTCPRCIDGPVQLTYGELVKTPVVVNNNVKGFNKGSIIQRIHNLENFRTSTKIEALKEEIQKMVE